MDDKMTPEETERMKAFIETYNDVLADEDVDPKIRVQLTKERDAFVKNLTPLFATS